MLKFLFLILTFSLVTYAEEEILLEDFQTIDEITLRNEKITKEREIEIHQQKLKWAQEFAKQIQLEDIEKSGTFRAFLKRETILLSLDNEEKFVLPKDVYAILYRMPDKEGYQYIITKSEEVKYKVKATEVSNIEVITNLDRPPHYYTPKEQVYVKPFYNEKPSYWVETNVLLGFAKSSASNELAGESSSNLSSSFKFEGASYFDFNIPLYIGASVQWETMTLDSAAQKILSFGPSFQSKNFEFLGAENRFTTSLRLSLYGNLTQDFQNETRDTNLRATAWQLGFIREKNFEVGTFLYGLHYQREWLRPKSSGQSLGISTETTTNNLVSVSVGWKWF